MTLAASTTKALMEGSVVMTISLNAFLSICLSSVKSLINSLQLIFHLPIISIIAPGNVLTMFKIVVPIVMFDIMESITYFQDLWPDSESDMLNSPNLRLTQLVDIGYDSFNPILNLGTLFVLVLLYLLQCVIFVTVIWPMRKLKWIRGRTYFWIKNRLFWKAIIFIFVEGYIEFVLSARLLFVSHEESVDRTPLQWFVCWSIVGLCFILMPLMYSMLLFQNIVTLRKSKSFRRRWFSLYDEISLKDKWSLLSNVTFCLRRIIYVEIAFKMGDYPCQQIQLLLLMGLGIQIYIGRVRPMHTRSLNLFEFFNDICVFLVTQHFLLFTDIVPDMET
jgi:hypothetical protein